MTSSTTTTPPLASIPSSVQTPPPSSLALKMTKGTSEQKPLQLGPVPKPGISFGADKNSDEAQKKQSTATFAKPQSFAIHSASSSSSTSGEETQQQKTISPPERALTSGQLAPGSRTDSLKGKSTTFEATSPSSDTRSSLQPYPLAPPPVKRVEFKTTPEVERRSSSFRSSRPKDGDEADGRLGLPIRPGSQKKAVGPVRQLATRGETGESHQVSEGDLASGRSTKTSQSPGSSSWGREGGTSDDHWPSPPPPLGQQGDPRRTSSELAPTTTTPTGKIAKRTTFKEDLEEEIPPIQSKPLTQRPSALRSPPSERVTGFSEMLSKSEDNHHSAQPLSSPPSIQEPQTTSTSSSSSSVSTTTIPSSGSGKGRRTFVSLHSYPPTSAAIDADANLSHVLRNFHTQNQHDKGAQNSEPSEMTGSGHHHHHHQKDNKKLTESGEEDVEKVESEKEEDEEDLLGDLSSSSTSTSVSAPSSASSKALLVTQKPPIPPNKPKDYLPFSARLKSLRKEHKATTATAPSTLLQSKLQSTISKRIRDHGKSSEGATVSLLNNIDGVPTRSRKNKKTEDDGDSDSAESSSSSSGSSSSTESTSGSGSGSSSTSSNSDSSSSGTGELESEKEKGLTHHHRHHRHHHKRKHHTGNGKKGKTSTVKEDSLGLQLKEQLEGATSSGVKRNKFKNGSPKKTKKVDEEPDEEFDELGELAESGGVGGGGANAKKFNLLKAQMLVNEVHDWWLMHLS